MKFDPHATFLEYMGHAKLWRRDHPESFQVRILTVGTTEKVSVTAAGSKILVFPVGYAGPSATAHAIHQELVAVQ